MKVTLQLAKGRRVLGFKCDVEGLSEDMLIKDFRKQVATLTGIPVYQQGYKLERDGKVYRLDGYLKSLKDSGIQNNDVIQIKNLGPQFSYKGVFLVEYFGPILFVALYALRPSFVYGDLPELSQPYDWVAFTGILMFLAHFVKRELETLYVHKFSRPTMPMSNLYRNSIYYWAFAAVIGYPLCHPFFTAPCDTQVYIGLGVMAVSELMNFAVHFHLSRMRKGTLDNSRQPPSGPLFFVSCPNYFFEFMSWVGFSVMTNIAFSWLFTLAGLYQMSQWALDKHRRYGYHKQKGKYAILPFIL